MGVGRPRDGQPHLVPSSWDPSGYVTGRLWPRWSDSTNKSTWRESPWLPLPPLALPHYPPQVPPASAAASLTGRIWSPPHTWTQPADHYCNNPQSRAAPVLHTWKCHTIQEWLTEIGVQSISGVTTNERKVKENRPDRGIIMLNWTPYLGICQVTQTFSFVIREIERCVIFHHTQQTCL